MATAVAPGSSRRAPGQAPRGSSAPRRTAQRRRTATRWLVALAAGALALGALVYVADRPAGHASLLPASLAFGGLPSFGAPGLWLPSFVHPFAFSLLTAAALTARAAPALGACIAWWTVDIAFEVVQWPPLAAAFAHGVERVFGHGAPARMVTQYALRGTFDVGDLAAITLGALAAAGVLYALHPRESRHAC